MVSVVGVVVILPRIGRVNSTSAFDIDYTLRLCGLIAPAVALCCCCCLLLLLPAAVGDLEKITLGTAVLGSKPCGHTCLKCFFSFDTLIAS
jgi:hypothetical protein